MRRRDARYELAGTGSEVFGDGCLSIRAHGGAGGPSSKRNLLQMEMFLLFLKTVLLEASSDPRLTPQAQRTPCLSPL